MSPRPTRRRAIPLHCDDGIRGAITMTPGMIGFLIVAVSIIRSEAPDRVLLAGAGCVALIVSSGAYLIWTHLVFTRTPREEIARIAAVQHLRGPSRIARMLGLASAESWAVSVAFAALAGAVAAAVLGGRDGGTVLAVLALLTAATAWITVVYAFALRYFRFHSAGEEFRFDIDGPPDFSDFLSAALMISCAGAVSAAAPTGRAGLRAVRTHTVIAFAFNALVIAMTVSLISGLIATYDG